MIQKEIPYKIYLSEDEMPKQWYNVRADMKHKPAPLLNPGTLRPMTAEELEGVFCKELVKQELDNDTPYIDIPKEIHTFYKMYRPSPLVRAYYLEEALDTPQKSIISSRAIIPPAATSSILPLHRHIMPNSRA